MPNQQRTLKKVDSISARVADCLGKFLRDAIHALLDRRSLAWLLCQTNPFSTLVWSNNKIQRDFHDLTTLGERGFCVCDMPLAWRELKVGIRY